jgi:hypothetical protein
MATATSSNTLNVELGRAIQTSGAVLLRPEWYCLCQAAQAGISPKRATLLTNISRTYMGLASQLAMLADDMKADDARAVRRWSRLSWRPVTHGDARSPRLPLAARRLTPPSRMAL